MMQLVPSFSSLRVLTCFHVIIIITASFTSGRNVSESTVIASKYNREKSSRKQSRHHVELIVGKCSPRHLHSAMAFLITFFSFSFLFDAMYIGEKEIINLHSFVPVSFNANTSVSSTCVSQKDGKVSAKDMSVPRDGGAQSTMETPGNKSAQRIPHVMLY